MHRESLRICLVVAVALIPSTCAVVGGRKAALPPYDDPVVFVKNCDKFSRVEGHFNPSSRLYTFRGIRYAEAPVKEHRFLRPKLKQLMGDVDAKFNAPPCLQPDFYDPYKIIGDEDCLSLNIFTPIMPDDLVDYEESRGLPVLLWIHGGGFRYGSAAQYDAEPIIQDKLIFVPIQYRLGSLGLLGDGSKEFASNAAMFDMQTALQWVSKYISYFGGDPKQIKIIGHGSGAVSAMFLAAAPMGRSMINGVVAMSGSSLSQYSYDENATITNAEIATANNCSNDNATALVHCLRSKPASEIIRKDTDLQMTRLSEANMIKAMTGMLSFSPNIESADDDRSLPGLITSRPQDQLQRSANDEQMKIPLLIGVTRDETANGIDTKEINEIFKSGSEFLKATASALRLDGLLRTPQQMRDVFASMGATLTNYIAIPDKANPEKVLNKLIDATTDVFFNLPSVMTADLWGKFSDAFFYQFDHGSSGGMSGKSILRPLPLVSKNKAEAKGKVAHGDDLGYLFNICDVFGNRINGSEPKTKEDKETRRNFIELLTSFAYLSDAQPDFRLGSSLLKPFRSDSTNFIKISDKLTFEKDFRFCELTMWGAPLKATQKITCDFSKTVTSQISKVADKTSDVLHSMNPINKLG